jgi:pantoate--beta-alanine ligase
VLSIFVNPTQFNNAQDFDTYPKTWEEDLRIAAQSGVDAILAPHDPKSIYPDDFHYQLSENQFSKELCGEFRPGHFTGVLTVVLKLFQIVRPVRAYFGEKDHQQLSLIEGMVNAFFMDVKVIPCETLREPSGLALSSRNLRLSPEQKALAPKIYQTLLQVQEPETAKEVLSSLGFKVEYLVDRNDGKKRRRYVAAWLGDVRLIDNVEL